MRLLFAGDTFLKTKLSGDPFSRCREYVRSFDIAICNLETVLGSDVSPKSAKAVSLIAPSKNTSWLVDTGIRVVTLANNHTFDYGEEGFLQTTYALKRNNIKYVLDGQALMISESPKVFLIAKYIRLGKLSNLSRWGDVASLEGIVKALSQKGRVIVSLHWGHENTLIPSPRQRKIASQLVRSGADLIVGHHPHYPQGMEMIQDVPVYYSLGNFNFWQFDIPVNFFHRLGFVLEVEINQDDIRVMPKIITITPNYEPEINHTLGEEVLAALSVDFARNGLGYFDRWLTELLPDYFVGHCLSWMRRVRRGGVREFAKFLIWVVRPFNLLSYAYVPLLLRAFEPPLVEKQVKKVLEPIMRRGDQDA